MIGTLYARRYDGKKVSGLCSPYRALPLNNFSPLILNPAIAAWAGAETNHAILWTKDDNHSFDEVMGYVKKLKSDNQATPYFTTA